MHSSLSRMTLSASVSRKVAKGSSFRHVFVDACLTQIVTYDDFTEDNDPHGTHEMGFMEVMGRKVWFKIDLYDETFQYGTPAPTDLSKTRRVLTILLPSDY